MTTNEITNKIETGTKLVMGEILQKLQIYGFWSVVLIGIGILIGLSYYNKTRSYDIANTIKIGGFIYDGKVYDIKIRSVQ
jgi:hypothetical protein